MKPKTIKILYWAMTLLFALAMLFDGIGGITKQEAGVEVMTHLGYPVYAMVIFGVAKLAGVIAIVQNRFQTIKEWAYAGFAINFLGAFGSRVLAGDGFSESILPLVMLGIMFIPYFLWKKYDSIAAGKLSLARG